MSSPAPDTRTVLVTYDRPEEALQAGRALLDDDRIADPVRMQVQTDVLEIGNSPFRRTRARAGALLGAVLVGSALAILGGVAAMSGALPISVPLGVIAGLVLGVGYGMLAGALAGATELTPRLQQLYLRLASGKSAIAAEVAARDTPLARRVLMQQAGSDRAL